MNRLDGEAGIERRNALPGMGLTTSALLSRMPAMALDLVPAASVDPSLAGGKTILVVEDERIVARDIQRRLADLGYSVPATAASAARALQLASEHRPDLVLMDVRIRGKPDGIDTATILRSRFDVPILFLTAHADDDTVARARQTGPFGYLLKPVRSTELRTAIEIALFRHGTERLQREREQWLTAAMGSIGDAVISTDTLGRITYMNPIAEHLTGWGTEGGRGRSSDHLRLVDDRSRSALPNPLTAALRGVRAETLDCVLLRDGASERFVSSTTSPILDSAGAVMGAILVLRDMSERRDLQRHLERSDRLATVGTMAAGVAHEVNNPLAYIIANLRFAIDAIRHRRGDLGGQVSLDWTRELEGALVDAETGASHIAKVVGDLKGYSSVDPDTMESVNLEDVIDWSLDVADHDLRSRTQVTRRKGSMPLVDAPSGRLKQVFVNLLFNAAHALDPARRGTNELQVATRTDEHGRAVVEIRDNGCGMSRKVMDRAFEPFFTTKPVGQGTGLGLSVCHGITQSLGGTIAFESEPGEGTTVRVTLPASQRSLE